MGLNTSKGNMYSFITHTWNTIKGECLHNCSYCYVKRWGKLNPVRFDAKELKTDLGTGNYIFVGSSCDMFAENIEPKWIIETLMYCEKFKNDYFLQTKNPKAFSDYAVSIASLDNFSLCITLETNRHYKEVMGLSPTPKNRVKEFKKIPYVFKYITIEPIMDFDLEEFVEIIKECNPLQVNIGADSGNNNLPEPSKEKLLQLIDELKKFTIIHNKSNLKRLLK
jgi:DNA repair photolyase